MSHIAGTAYYLENDYSLREEVEYFTNAHHSRTLSRIFNFKAAQVTTIAREWVALPTGNALSSQMDIRNFSDIESKDELREMHARLIETGGHPPELGEVLPGYSKKTPRLSFPNAP